MDGTDIKPALQESTKGEWNGDVDMGDGMLNVLRQEYDKRKQLIECTTKPTTCTEQNLREIRSDLTKDIPFLSTGLRSSKALYEKKFSNPSTPAETLKQLNWEMVEYNTLLSQAQALQQFLDKQLSVLKANNNHSKHQVFNNLAEEKNTLITFLRNLFKKKRQPAASHILVFMLSEERRNQKPYALPVWYIPYHTLKDQYVHDFTKQLKQEMAKLNLKAVGKFHH